MKIPFFNTVLGYRLRHKFIDWALARPGDVYIGGEQNPYLIRRFLIPRNRFFNIYFHQFMRSDDDRALHDHPWWNISVVLHGAYLEHLSKAWDKTKANPRGFYAKHRQAGDIAFRGAQTAHRLQLLPGPLGLRSAITLFITGPRIRDWGFWCPKGWKHWKEFTAFRTTGASNEVGPGCGEP